MAIILPGGFDIRNNEPADARISLADQTARLGLSAANVYEGLIVYQRDNDTLYVLVDASDPSVSGNWSEVGAGTGTGNITGSGATNQVTYFTGATSVTGSNGFTFDGSDVVVTGDISASTYTGSLVSAGDINFPYGLDITGSLNVVNGQVSASFYTGSFAGVFTGDGSGLTGLTAENSGSQVRDDGALQGVATIFDFTDGIDVSFSASTASISLNRTGSFSGSFTGDISSSGHIVPSTTEIYDLGSTDLRWRDLYLSGSTIYLGSAQLSSIGQLLSGSFTGSFSGNASNISGVVSSSHSLNADNAISSSYAISSSAAISASFATTASYVEGAASDWDTLTNKPAGLVSSSTQVNADSVTNFDTNVKDKLNADGVISSSAQVTITESQISDLNHYDNTDNLTYLNSLGVISSSAQVDYDSIQNVPSGIVSSSGQVDYTGLSNIPSGIVSSSQQINTGSFSGSFTGNFTGDGSGLTGLTAENSGSQVRDDGVLQGVATIFDFTDGIDVSFSASTASISLNRTGSFTGSFVGDGSGITGVVSSSYALTSSYSNTSEWTGLNSIPSGLVSSSAQVNADSVTNFDSNVLTYINSLGAISSSTQVDYDSIQNVPSGIVSSSDQVDYTGLSNVPSGLVSSSTQITITESQISDLTHYTDTDTLDYINTVGVFSSSAQVNADSVTNFDSNVLTYINSLGAVSSSAQVDYTGLSNVPSGIISSSTQIDGSQVTGVVSASYAVTASHALNGGGGGVTINNNVDTYLVTATGTADTLDGESKLTFDGTTFNVDGAFTANTKSFLIDHQSQPGKKLIYGVLEGPEHAVYLRGRLTNDDTIAFPEEWSWLVDKDSITVQLTPIGSHQQLWVEQITETSITVNSNTDIDCYYLVHATRKDVDPLQTVE